MNSNFTFANMNNLYISAKVHIFWEGHKILQNLHLTFVRYYRTIVRGRFRKILWPSQNIWTLIFAIKNSISITIFHSRECLIFLVIFLIIKTAHSQHCFKVYFRNNVAVPQNYRFTYFHTSDEPEPSWLELNNYRLGSWPFPSSSEISLLRLENRQNNLFAMSLCPGKKSYPIWYINCIFFDLCFCCCTFTDFFLLLQFACFTMSLH